MRNLRRCMSDRSDPGSVIPEYRFFILLIDTKKRDPQKKADLFFRFLYQNLLYPFRPADPDTLPLHMVFSQITLSLCRAKLSTITFICSRKNSSIPVV